MQRIIHTTIHACTHTYIQKDTYTDTGIHMQRQTNIQTRQIGSKLTHMYTYICTCMHGYIHKILNMKNTYKNNKQTSQQVIAAQLTVKFSINDEYLTKTLLF